MESEAWKLHKNHSKKSEWLTNRRATGEKEREYQNNNKKEENKSKAKKITFQLAEKCEWNFPKFEWQVRTQHPTSVSESECQKAVPIVYRRRRHTNARSNEWPISSHTARK